MFIARIMGTVVCTQKVAAMANVKLLLIQPLNDDLSERGPPVVAADIIRQAGPGDMVYVIEKKEATFPFTPVIPVDLGVAGYIDEHYVDLGMVDPQGVRVRQG